MVLTDLFRTALRNVAANKMCALLTMLGVVIGVASVIAMLALGNGARAAVDASFQFLGANQIQIGQRYSMQEGEFKPMGEILSYEDGLGLIEAISLITRVDMSVSKDVRARYGRSVIDISAAGSTAQTLDAIVSDSPPRRKHHPGSGDSTGRRAMHRQRHWYWHSRR
jgi:putative ABC transport system permease protein